MYRTIFEELPYDDLDTDEKEAISIAKKNIKNQTSVWHINSTRKVAAVIYIQKLDKYISGQNIGISKVTGTLCAERAAIANVVAYYPKMKLNDIEKITIITEDSPILPCGVCCEWLYKINPEMILLTYDSKTNKAIRISIKDYYGDEMLIYERWVRSSEDQD